MALYYYQAYSKSGKKISGYLDAATVANVREQLSLKGIYPIKIDLAPDVERVPFYKRIFQRSISLKDKVFFTKQLAILLKAGIPLVQALDLLSEQTEGYLQSIVIYLRDNIKEGKSLADGLNRYPKVFDSIYIQLVKAGEASGKLEVILERLTEFLERRDEIRKTVKSALRTPLIQLAVIILVVILLLTFVVPQIVDVFKEQDIKLPLATRILTSISDLILNRYILLLSILIFFIIIYRAWASTESGRYTIDKIKLKLPIAGYFIKTQAIVQFCRTLGMLLEGGVNLSQALTIVTKIVDNKVLATELEKAKENIIKQGKISHYLKETGLFPPMATYLINTGEQSGQLDTMLLTVAKYYEDDLKERADTLSSLLNPVMLLIMALVVGFIILAIMGPIQSITKNLSTSVTAVENTK